MVGLRKQVAAQQQKQAGLLSVEEVSHEITISCIDGLDNDIM